MESPQAEPPRPQEEPLPPPRYFGLRPRRSIRRGALVFVSLLLLAIIAAEAAWLLRHGT